jgi:hypothetical protein
VPRGTLPLLSFDLSKRGAVLSDRERDPRLAAVVFAPLMIEQVV